MAYSIRKEKVVKYRDEENKQPLVYFEFNCDEVADLPNRYDRRKGNRSRFYRMGDIYRGILWLYFYRLMGQSNNLRGSY